MAHRTHAPSQLRLRRLYDLVSNGLRSILNGVASRSAVPGGLWEPWCTIPDYLSDRPGYLGRADIRCPSSRRHALARVPDPDSAAYLPVRVVVVSDILAPPGAPPRSNVYHRYPRRAMTLQLSDQRHVRLRSSPSFALHQNLCPSLHAVL